MGKWRQGQKYFLSIALAAAIMLTEMPLTALAAPETGITAEAESAQAQTGEDAEQEQQTQEEDKEESASQTGDDASQEQPAQNGEGETAEDTSQIEDDASQEQPAQNGEDETAEDTSLTEDDASKEQPAQEDTEEDASLTGDNTTEGSPADGENESAEEDAAASEEIAGEEVPEEQTETMEAMEELSAVSASGGGFTISDGALTAYTGTDTDIVIPDGVTAIGKNVFKDNKTIQTVTFSSSVVTIENNAFQGCSNLKSVTLNNGLKTIERNAFESCVSLESLELPSTVTTIGNYAFQNCTGLKSVKLNEGLKTIGTSAFKGAGLGNMAAGENLVIPGTVESIGEGAFYSCKYLETVSFKNGANEVLDLKSGGSHMKESTFGKCENLIKVELPDRLRTINYSTFDHCEKLKEVSFGSRLDTIGGSAFNTCVNLERIELPSTVTTIGNCAFESCTGLKSLKLNEGLKTIGLGAFSYAGLGNMAAGENLIIPGTVESIGVAAFYSCKYLETVTFENGANEVLDLKSGGSHMKESTFGKCENLTRVELPDRLRTINDSTFAECKKLKEVSFGSRLDTIGWNAFNTCVSLERIELPSTVTTIGNGAFENCTGLKSVKLNEGLKTIGLGAFSYAGLGNMAAGENLVIPSTVESIGTAAFYSCKYLETVTFENGTNEVLDLKSAGSHIKGSTFGSCENLTTVILPERITILNVGTFENNPKLEILYIPEKVKEIKSSAALGCPKLTIYGVPGSTAETYANEKQIPFKNKSELGAGVKVQSVSVTPDIIKEAGEAAIGKQIQLYAVILPNNAVNKKVTYSSNNEQVASVDEKGLVTIKGYGEAKITVTTEDGGKTTECAVYITEEAAPEDPPQEPTEEPTGSKKPEIKESLVFFPKNAIVHSAVYTGEQVRPAMAVFYECEYQDAAGNTKTQKLKLKLNVDYTVRYAGNINVGENTAKVTVRGIGEYGGTVSKNFTIKAKSISGVKLSPVGDILYGQTPSVVVTDGNRELKENTDYTVEYTPKGSADTDTVSTLKVKGIGNYTGLSQRSVKFNILKTSTDPNVETGILPLNAKTVSIGWKNPAKVYTYNGKAQKPAVVVTDNATGKKLSASRYKVIYTNNINAGDEARAYVVGVSKNGKGYYGMADPLTFSIKKKDFKKITAVASVVPKAGSIEDVQNAIRESLVVKDGKRILEAESDYTIDFGEIKRVEEIKTGRKYEITLTPAAKGNYDQNTRKTVKIKFGQLNLGSKAAKVTVTITNPSQNEIILTYNGDTLKKDTDYTAKVSKDKKGDTYTVKIKAVKGGAYKGSRTVKKLKLK